MVWIPEYSGMDLTYYPYAALSTTTFLVSYKYMSPHFSAKYFPAYKVLPKTKQVDWDSRVVSSVHSIIVSLVCFYALMYEDEVSKNPVWAESKVIKFNCAVVIGYLVSDSLILVVNYKAMGEICYLFHHGASIYAFYFVVTYGALPWYANFRLISEFSTPLVNQRWFLDCLGYPRSSPIFLLNGLAMAVIFFMVRILSIPPYWYKVYIMYGTEACQRLGNIWYVLLSSCIVLDVLNVYWFIKIFHGARKILRLSADKNQNKLAAGKID